MSVCSQDGLWFWNQNLYVSLCPWSCYLLRLSHFTFLYLSSPAYPPHDVSVLGQGEVAFMLCICKVRALDTSVERCIYFLKVLNNPKSSGIKFDAKKQSFLWTT